jgi:hypothetical protein
MAFCCFLNLFVIAAENESVSPQEQAFKQFQSVSDKICSELVTNQNKIAEKEGWGLTENDLKEAINKASLELMARFKEAFIISEAEAQKILSGEYDNTKNKKDIKDCVDKITKYAAQLPLPVQYLLSKYQEGSLSGLELEFTARVFKEYVKQVEEQAQKR